MPKICLQLQEEIGKGPQSGGLGFSFWKTPENKEERLQKLNASILDLVKTAEVIDFLTVNLDRRLTYKSMI